jgi:hypothetical protein
LLKGKRGNIKIKFSIVKVSNHNKFFPHDFFSTKGKGDSANITREDSLKLIVKKDLGKVYMPTDPLDDKIQKRLFDFDKELEEDKELLDLLETKSISNLI